MKLLTCGISEKMNGFLKSQHFVLNEAVNGDDVLSLLSLDAKQDGGLYGFDILIADMGRHDIGASFPRRVRNSGSHIGVIMTRKHGGRDVTYIRTKVLENGGDYCLMPLTDPYELRASISSCVRRMAGSSSNVISAGPITVDLAGKTATVDGVLLRLTRYEFIVLSLLVSRKGRLISREVLLNNLPIISEEEEDHLPVVLVCKLRKKLDEASEESGDHIVTMGKDGYLFTEEPHPGVHARLRKRRLQTHSLNRAH